MSESGATAQGDNSWHGVGQRFYDRWLDVRRFLKGLTLAWVSTASAVIGFVLFFVAAPAQDLLLESYDRDPFHNVLAWTSFYLVVILFWALPVFVSARWILSRFEEGGAPPRLGMEPVPSWVRTFVPALLAAICLLAVLSGQLMALRTTPPNLDSREFIKEAESGLNTEVQRRACSGQFTLSRCKTLLTSLAIVVGSNMGGRITLPNVVLLSAALLAFWFYIARPTVPSSLRSVRIIRRTIIAFITCVAFFACCLLIWFAANLLEPNMGMPDGMVSIITLAPLPIAFGIFVLAWLGKERLLWWLGTVCGLACAVAVGLAFYGIVELERKSAFGIVHLLLLPFVSAGLAVLAWWGLSRRPDGQATRIGRLLLRLTGAKGALSDKVATARLVNPIFYVLVTLTVVLNVLFMVVNPLDVTEPWSLSHPWRINRVLLLPVILGLPVALLTFLTYGSVRLRVPLVLGAVVLVGAWNLVREWVWDDYFAVRPAELPAARPTLDDAVRQWAKVNACDLAEQKAAADAGKERPCLAPIIVTAAGGASRAAFHLVSVIGKLIDGERFAPLAGHKGVVYSAAFSRDRSLIITASLDNTARIWDGKTGAQKVVLDLRAKGHSARVQSAAFSPDGKRAVTASWDRTAKIWNLSDLQDVKLLKTLPHPADVNGAVFSPDGKFVVTGADDGKARVWNAETEQVVELAPAHKKLIYSIAISPDGKRIVTASWDGTAKIWNVSSPSDISEWKTLPHPTDVNAAAFSPDGTLVVTGADDGVARIWDAQTGRKKAELPPHKQLVHGVSFSPDGRRVVTASWDGTAMIWDVSNLNDIKGFKELKGHASDINSATYSADGKFIITASDDRTARIWDAEDGIRIPWEAEVGNYPLFGKQLFAISAVSGGALGAAVTYAALADSQRNSGSIASPPCNQQTLLDRHWFAAKREAVEPSENPQTSWKACLQLLVSGDFLSPTVVGLTRDPLPIATDNRATVLEKSWEERYRQYTARDPKSAVAKVGTLAKPMAAVRRELQDGWLPILLLNGTSVEDGRRIITTDVDLSDLGGDGIERVFHDAYDFHALRVPGRKFTGHTGPVYSVAATTDGTRIVTGSEDKTAHIWDAEKGISLATLIGHKGRVHSVAFSIDGKRVVTASWDRTAKIWDVSSRGGRLLKTIEHGSDVNTAAFSPDRKLLVTGSDNGKTRVWDAETGDMRVELLPPHTKFVYGAAFSPDGKRIVTASWDGTAKIWDVSDLKGVKVLRTLQHNIDVNAAAFSPDDGKLVATGADDGVARIWDAETGDLKAELPRHGDILFRVTFSPDGKRILTSSWDRTAKIWDVSDLSQVKELKLLKGHRDKVNGGAFIGPDGRFVATVSDDKAVRVWDVDTGRARWTPCLDCDLPLSAAVTMSARFPLISPTGSFLDRDRKKVRRVVDGGYYENFGAATAREVAKVLEKVYGLEPVVILVNNEHTVSGLECVTPNQPPPEEEASWLWSPVNTVIGTRTARGSHAAVSLCDELNTSRFAFLTVAADPTNRNMTLSVSWWMSKNVQAYLDRQLAHDVNRSAFETITKMRQKPNPNPSR